MSGWSAFNKYCGVQGIMALLLVGGFVYASMVGIKLTDFYGQLMTLIIGFYFAKNGVGILETLKAILTDYNNRSATKKG